MNSLEEQLRHLQLQREVNSSKNSRREAEYVQTGKVAALVDNLQQKCANKTAPSIPAKPYKKSIGMPQVPLSKQVTDTQEPLYSQPLQSLELLANKETGKTSILLRKQPIYTTQSGDKMGTLDNPVVLEQQLEALAYHKLQMEKRGLLGYRIQTSSKCIQVPNISNITNLSSTSLNRSSLTSQNIYCSNRKIANSLNSRFEYCGTILYSNMQTSSSSHKNNDLTSSTMEQLPEKLSIFTESTTKKDMDEELLPPPSPVSSSYSELQRANGVYNKSRVYLQESSVTKLPVTTYENYVNQCTQNSTSKTSTYDSIYEPINPRLSNEVLRRGSFSMYANIIQSRVPPTSSTCEDKSSTTNCENTVVNSKTETLEPSCSTNCTTSTLINDNNRHYHLSSIDSADEVENYGRCFKCGDRVIGESSGCTAMDQTYHISCFRCTECQINLQGKPFYALEGNPFCEYDYLQTLEKCSVCLNPILERILRATGKPYHPQCFTCVVCGNSLDAVPFTVDATNQNYCIADFHKKFAPRCCVCKEPILPESGQEETVRVVALDRSFHLECYKCEDCGLLLSSEADGRGCYPLDDHVLCKSCNAGRVQVLTNRMT